MVVTEFSIIHHVGIVLLLLWLLNWFHCCHSIFYLFSLIYLCLVQERYTMRLRRKLQFEERKAANQRRILTDSETVRWLNHAVEKMWPICMEQIISQRIFLPIIPWFLAKYKPWTVKKVTVRHLYLGRTPPFFTEIRVLRESSDDDHLVRPVLELGLNFLTADDMSAVLVAKLRKLGFGIVTKLHLTGMHVEGKVLVGVKFLRSWPFIGRLRVCFAEPPYFQMTVKPIFSHGLDVTEVPGIAGWLDNLLAIAFEETLVEPNMLVVDLEKFVSPQQGRMFSILFALMQPITVEGLISSTKICGMFFLYESGLWSTERSYVSAFTQKNVDEKEPLAHAIVEVIEAADLKPSDLNGLADPYVKGHLGPYRFTTQIQRKTLAPKWIEEFKVPICSWDAQCVLEFEVRDKDHFKSDDCLGKCSVDISDLRDGQRHDMWLPLVNVKMGRLHLAVTVIEANAKGKEHLGEVNIEGGKRNSLPSEMAQPGPIPTESQERSQKVADTFEAIDVQGQKNTGIWVHHPGSEISQAWEPRKGKSRHTDAEILPLETPRSSKEPSLHTDSSSSDDSKDGHRTKRGNIFRRGIQKLFPSHSHKHSKNVDSSNSTANSVPSPHSNVKPRHLKRVGVKLVMGDGISEALISAKTPKPLGNADEEVDVLSDSSDDEDSPSSSLHDPSVGQIPIASVFMPRDVNYEPEHPTAEAHSDVAVEQDVDLKSSSEGNEQVPIQESLKPSP
ncbi:LOW QUALITY PROTEIN: hypothetical protein Cgig2_010913 [Carnegiea gigantea]|uniref:C2 domain-containing protein n=1 Tax=Carnegiea gigantea TaxID=171969 RepID=A0A9Q1JH60_9CARY|nr:LOW QUALITY PROTEIN: hypothetical protein Cgig2_010913 [Carnegiea gigantea]